MNALLIALLVAQAPDVPVVEADIRPAIEVKAGELVPFNGTCMDDARTTLTGKRIASCEASLAKAEDKSVITMIPTPVLVGGVVAILGVIAAASGAAFVAGQSARK